MPDLSAPVGALLELIGPLLGHALRSFLATALGTTALVLFTTGACAMILSDASPWAVGAVMALALAGGVVMVGMLSAKRAVFSALAHGLETLGLSRRLLGLVFDRVLRVDDAAEHGDRGNAAARAAERVPLAQAERRLHSAVNGLLSERAGGRGVRAFFARKIHATALQLVERVTLRAFRNEQETHGGVDLVRVRDELSVRIDAAVLDAVRGASAKVTALFVVGYCGLALLLAWSLSA